MRLARNRAGMRQLMRDEGFSSYEELLYVAGE
jgi:hypothetical protein